MSLNYLLICMCVYVSFYGRGSAGFVGVIVGETAGKWESNLDQCRTGVRTPNLNPNGLDSTRSEPIPPSYLYRDWVSYGISFVQYLTLPFTLKFSLTVMGTFVWWTNTFPEHEGF